jgi:hypothetical protein
MKLFLITFAFIQIAAVLSIDTAVQEQRALIDIWDFINPVVSPVAQGIDSALGAVANVQSAVTGAVSGAIYGVTSWIGGKLPALGKRDISIDTRYLLLTELRSFQVNFQQIIRQFVQKVLNDRSLTSTNIMIEIRQLLSQLSGFMQTHLNTINSFVTVLIPTMEDTIANQAMSSVVNAVQIIKQTIETIETLLASS